MYLYKDQPIYVSNQYNLIILESCRDEEVLNVKIPLNTKKKTSDRISLLSHAIATGAPRWLNSEHLFFYIFILRER